MTTLTNPLDVQVPNVLPGSSLAVIHKASGPLRRALADLPEWAGAMDALTHLAGIRPERRNYASPEVEVDELLSGLVESRQSLDVEVALRLARDVADRLAAHDALSRAFETTAAKYTARADEVVRSHEGDLYDHLSGQAVALVDAGREISHVVGMDAAGAIAAEAASEWQQIAMLRDQYRAVCAARGTLEQHLSSIAIGVPTYPELRFLANPTDVFEHWRPWRIDGALIDPRNIRDRTPLRSPWPDQRERMGNAALIDGWFDYLTRTPKAQPWLPTPAQYTTAARALELLERGEG